MDFIEEALEGSLRAGKSPGGRKGVMLTLLLPERSVYQLQRLLEEWATVSDNYFKVRATVLLSEDLRMAVADAEQAAAEELAEAKVKFRSGGHL